MAARLVLFAILYSGWKWSPTRFARRECPFGKLRWDLNGFFSLLKESFIGFYFSVVPRIEERRRTLNQQLDDQQLKNLLQIHYRQFCLKNYVLLKNFLVLHARIQSNFRQIELLNGLWDWNYHVCSLQQCQLTREFSMT